MTDKITVRDVIETHDCAGRKTICVTAMEEDEIVSSKFRLTKAYMTARQKLLLGSVDQMDEVSIVPDETSVSPMIIGEYIDILNDKIIRPSMCKCGSNLISDGFDIYCPNDQCGLTLFSRLERLNNAPFFDYCTQTSIYLSDSLNSCQPFSGIINPGLWGFSQRKIEDILLTNNKSYISLATFLVEPLFREFLDSVSLIGTNTGLDFSNLSYFYYTMKTLVSERDYESQEQEHFIKAFFWSLGLESLTRDIFERMLQYEKMLGWNEDVLTPYAYFLNHPSEMVKELHIHPLEARAVTLEFHRRKYEFIDIFEHYSSKESIRDIFNQAESGY